MTLLLCCCDLQREGHRACVSQKVTVAIEFLQQNFGRVKFRELASTPRILACDMEPFPWGGVKVPVYCVQVCRGLTHFPSAWDHAWERVVDGAPAWLLERGELHCLPVLWYPVRQPVGHTHHAGSMMSDDTHEVREADGSFCRDCSADMFGSSQLQRRELPGRRRNRTSAARCERGPCVLYLRTLAPHLQYVGAIFVQFDIDICPGRELRTQFWDSGGLFWKSPTKFEIGDLPSFLPCRDARSIDTARYRSMTVQKGMEELNEADDHQRKKFSHHFSGGCQLQLEISRHGLKFSGGVSAPCLGLDFLSWACPGSFPYPAHPEEDCGGGCDIAVRARCRREENHPREAGREERGRDRASF